MYLIQWVEQGVWYGVTAIDTWRIDYIYVLSVLGRALHPWVEQGVWYRVTAIDTWRIDYIYVLLF